MVAFEYKEAESKQFEEPHLSEECEFAGDPILQGRVVLIAGGTAGIGEKLVQAFAEHGAQVVLLDGNVVAANARFARTMPMVALAPTCWHCDLTDLVAVEGCLRQIIDHFGTIDVMIHSADSGEGDDTFEFQERCAAVNRQHESFATQASIPGIRWQGGGVMINMSAHAWLSASGSLPAYSAGKAAVIGFTRAFARELEPSGIGVNVLLPGPVEAARHRRHAYTSATPQVHVPHRTLQPEDIARLALFLASDCSNSYTSQKAPDDAIWL